MRRLLVDARQRGAGHRYLIQHSAGSGKSNSIAWLAHQLIDLQVQLEVQVQGQGQAPDSDEPLFDTVVVVTDRRILDDQIEKTVKQFMQVGATGV